MAQIKQQIKRIGTSEKARVRNASVRSAVRTQMKKVRLAVEKNDKALALTELNKAYALIDKSVSKGVQTRNTAARQKAELTKAVNKLA